jgi:hypothetical protein
VVAEPPQGPWRVVSATPISHEVVRLPHTGRRGWSKPPPGQIGVGVVSATPRPALGWLSRPISQNGGWLEPFFSILFFFLILTFKFLKFYYFFNKVNNMCQVLICLTWNSISFINGIWMEVVFDNMPISEVPHAIESETKVGKIKL